MHRALLPSALVWTVLGGLQACAERPVRYPPPSPAPVASPTTPPPSAPPPSATTPPSQTPLEQAAPAPAPLFPPPLPAHVFERAQRYADSTNLTLYSYHTKHIGNVEGYLAPILQTQDGGFLVVGTRRPPGSYRVGVSKPVVAKLDAHGKKQWERPYPHAGFLDYEAASAIEVSEGFIVYILSYVHPGRGAVVRLLRLSPKGDKVWDTRLRGKGREDTPFAQTVRLVGLELLLEGHIYKDASDTAYGWRGTVSLDGKVLSDEVGATESVQVIRGGFRFARRGFGFIMA